MPSPFPGMNPYLEQEALWQDFHHSYIPAIRDALSQKLSPHFIVKIEEYIYIHEPSARERFARADVAIVPSPSQKLPGSATTVLKPPQRLELCPELDMEKQLYLEIRDIHDRTLVAVIELLSPSNKNPGKDREAYLGKRNRLLRSKAHFIEIDLLRGGPRIPIGKSEPNCDYCILVSRAEDRPMVDFWSISLRDRLPVIPIPLRPPYGDVTIDLQHILNEVYDRANYQNFIYLGSPTPPLEGDDVRWADDIVKANLPQRH